MREDVLARRPPSTFNTSPAPDIPAAVDDVKGGGGGDFCLAGVAELLLDVSREECGALQVLAGGSAGGPVSEAAAVAAVPGTQGRRAFAAGAIAGTASKTLTAPLDRVKLLMQVIPDDDDDDRMHEVFLHTHGLRAVEEGGKRGIGFIEAMAMIGKEEGIKGYWKGNLPQVIRIIPYSAVQLFAYETYKKLFKEEDAELSVIGRLAAGACADMTSTLVALKMLREGLSSFSGGLGPSLIGIAPYIAKSLPEKYQKRPESSLETAILSATSATLMGYPLDTVRRQMLMKDLPYKSVLDAFPGIVERDGLIGLYRGFVLNSLKNLPNSSIKLTTFDTVNGLIAAGQKECQKIVEENRAKIDNP